MEKRYRNIKAVIFDMDGVIVDSENLWRRSFKIANKKLGVHVSEKFRRSCAGIPFEINIGRLQELMPKLNADEYMQLAKKIHRELISNDELEMKSGFIEIVEYLKSRKIKTALCTGSSFNHVCSVFEKMGINFAETFDHVVTSDMVSKGKPDPESYIKACEGINEEPKDCLVLEDSINGINAAYAAGAIPVMVIDIIKPDKITKTKCDFVAKSLNQVMKMI